MSVTDPAGAADLLQRHDPLAVARVGPCWMPTFLACVTSAPLRQGPWQGIGMKLGMNSFCKGNRFVLCPQILSQDLRCCASFAQGLSHQAFGGGTGAREKAAQDKLRLKDRLHPPLGQGLEMPDDLIDSAHAFSSTRGGTASVDRAHN